MSIQFEQDRLYLYSHPDGLYLYKCVPQGMLLIANTARKPNDLTPFYRIDTYYDDSWDRPIHLTDEHLARLL